MKKNKIYVTIIGIIIIFISCKKDRFSNFLIGTWVEQTDESFKEKLIFTKDTLFYFQDLISVDTFIYKLKNERKNTYLRREPVSPLYSIGYVDKISINRKKNEITIWFFKDLFEMRETKFVKN
jgi:hypothetical protein